MGESTKPERAHTIIVKLGADTIDDLADALRQMAIELERGGLRGIATSGSPSAGYVYEHRETEKSHDAYFAELDAYLSARRA